MNQERRQKISDIHSTITDLQSALDSLMDEEQETYDCLRGEIQESAKGEDMMAAVESLESASCGLQDVLDYLEGIP